MPVQALLTFSDSSAPLSSCLLGILGNNSDTVIGHLEQLVTSKSTEHHSVLNPGWCLVS